MSKILMTTKDIPQYVRDIVTGRLYYAKPSEVTSPGYTFRLYGRWPLGYEDQLRKNAEKLVGWALRYHADAKIISRHFWDKEKAFCVERSGICDYAASKRKASRAGYRNYIVVEISDPVARILEIGGYVKGGANG